MLKPVKVILDTDIGPDCDDAGALAVLHALADRDEARILGIMHCTSSPWGAGCIDVINTYYGRPDIPIGTLKEPGFLDGEAYQKYNRAICEAYPNRFNYGKEPVDAVSLYRDLMSREPDGDVVIIAIGPLTNLRNLMLSKQDKYSNLDGIELVRRKVAQLVIMGGKFPSGLEWNFQMDASSAQYVVDNWPTRVTFSGFEIGYDLMTGKRLFLETPEPNPVRKSYELYLGQPGNRNSWDLTAVLYGVQGPSDYWNVKTGGYVEVNDDGESIWRDSVDGRHGYLTKKMETHEISRILEELLVQQPKQ